MSERTAGGVPCFTAFRGEPLRGECRVPGDKSITHRSLMLGAIAEGDTRIDGALRGEDCLASARALRQMGVEVTDTGDTLEVRGVGPGGLGAPPAPLDMGNAGTGMRLMAGLLAGQGVAATLVGDASLSRRPMGRIIRPLAAMGADIDAAADGRPPLELRASRALRGIDYTLPMASAQVKSAVLLAGLGAVGETVVREPAVTRDHTERMLAAFGAQIGCVDGVVTLRPGATLRGQHIEVPGDISSAAFFLVAASIVPGSDLILQNIGVNPTRTGIIDALRLMGANIELLNSRVSGGEPVADIHVRSEPLRGIDLPVELVPLAIDELPVLFVAAAAAVGTTRVTGAQELRVKESDRLAAMADGLGRLGVTHSLTPDGIVIEGGPVSGGEVDSFDDHRIAMAFAVAGQVASAPVRVHDVTNVATSFPGFADLAVASGMNLNQ